jgi:hypothetical protein
MVPVELSESNLIFFNELLLLSKEGGNENKAALTSS